MDKMRDSIRPVIWRDGRLFLLDQRQLPTQQRWLEFEHPDEVARAIRDMVVRGAPAIGIAAAYGVVLAAKQAWNIAGVNWKQAMTAPLAHLLESRPTAVNLRWAIHRMTLYYESLPTQIEPEEALLMEAHHILTEDIAANHKMGELGAALINPGSAVLTHCNAGALATGGFGTALGVIRTAYADRKISQIYVDETRPWLQGARLTAWELQQEGLPVMLQTDQAAASLMAAGKIDWVIVGADRITAKGDVANKVGTYMLAVLAQYHRVKVMVVAPTATIDWQLHDGYEIPIEMRPEEEITQFNGQPLAPAGIMVRNPAFDVTPAHLIDAIVTEAGVIIEPTQEKMLTLKE